MSELASEPTTTAPPTLVILAKAPVPGRVKTRLSPPCTPEEAASLAAAALADTIAAVAATPARRRVLVVEGDLGPGVGVVVPEGFDVMPQRGDGLDERLAAAFEDVGQGPTVLVGMDTPQATPGLLEEATAALEGGADVVYGPADDGGYWLIGLQHPDPEVFLGVPMSADDTGARQLERIDQLGLGVAMLPALRDVDEWADAVAVADAAPSTRFAAAVRR